MFPEKLGMNCTKNFLLTYKRGKSLNHRLLRKMLNRFHVVAVLHECFARSVFTHAEHIESVSPQTGQLGVHFKCTSLRNLISIRLFHDGMKKTNVEENVERLNGLR